MGLASDKPVKVDDTAFIATSFPGFHSDDAARWGRSFHEASAMSAAFDRDALLDAFDRIGRAAVQAGTKLQICGVRRLVR